MSRIGGKPINTPAGVEVKTDDNVVTVKGVKGTLTQQSRPNTTISQEGSELIVIRPNDEKENRTLHGLTRTLAHNMVVGMIEGFKKGLSVLGAGYRVQKQGRDLVMNLGYSHQVIVSEIDEIQIEAPMPNKIITHGIDKRKVGRFAAEARKKRPLELYKGEEIRYAGEFVRRKEDKANRGSKK